MCRLECEKPPALRGPEHHCSKSLQLRRVPAQAFLSVFVVFRLCEQRDRGTSSTAWQSEQWPLQPPMLQGLSLEAFFLPWKSADAQQTQLHVASSQPEESATLPCVQISRQFKVPFSFVGVRPPQSCHHGGLWAWNLLVTGNCSCIRQDTAYFRRRFCRSRQVGTSDLHFALLCVVPSLTHGRCRIWKIIGVCDLPVVPC